MNIRLATPTDAANLGHLASRMWEHAPDELASEFAVLTASSEAACFLAFDGDTAIGFAQCQLRHDYVEGCESSPVGFLEGIFVAEGYRLTGMGRALLAACEKWAKDKGCSEFASDCELDNTVSLAWHMKNGFTEMGRTIWFAKKL